MNRHRRLLLSSVAVAAMPGCISLGNKPSAPAAPLRIGLALLLVLASLPLWALTGSYYLGIGITALDALGTMFGGWRIVKTMGSGITRLQPVGGFCAETAAATTIMPELSTVGGSNKRL